MVTKSSLTKKLASYSAIAAAVLAVDRNADAQIVYTAVNPNFVGTADTSYLLDLNNDGINDFKILAHRSSFRIGNQYYEKNEENTSIEVIPFNSNQLVDSPFVSGRIINSKIQSWGGSADLAYEKAFNSSSMGSPRFSSFTFNGPWINSDTAYLPLKFNASGKTYYGWARLLVNPNQFILTGYAYNATPDSGIYAGQKCDIQFPTPTIAQNGNQLITTASTKIQWYLNNQPVPGDTTQSITAPAYGIYSVTEGDTTICHAISLPFNYINCSTLNPTISTSTQVICVFQQSPKLSLDTLPPYYSVQWLLNDSILTDATTQTFIAKVVGNYSAIVSEEGGCTDTTSVISIIYDDFTYIPSLAQKGDTLYSSFNGHNNWYYNYNDDNNDTTQNLINGQYGLYQVSVSDSLGCTNYSIPFYYISCNAFNSTITSSTKGLCPGFGYTFLKVDTLFPFYTVQWYRNDTLISTATNQTFGPSYGGNYFAIIQENGGCIDTTLSLYLPVDSFLVAPTISQQGNTLVSSSTYGNQWYDFDTNKEIYGATKQIYSPSEDGDYYVVFTDSLGCFTYSNRIYFSFETGINNVSSILDINIYEYNNQLNIKFNNTPYNGYQLSVYNYLGQKIISSEINSGDMIFDLSALAKGLYLVSLEKDNTRVVKKIVLD